MVKVKFPKYYKRLFTPKVDSEDTPFILFYKWVLSHTCPSQSLLFEGLEIPGSNLAFQVNSVAVQEEEQEKLKSVYTNWLRRGVDDDASQRFIDYQYGMASLQIGPDLIRKDNNQMFPKWLSDETVELGYVYVDNLNIWKPR